MTSAKVKVKDEIRHDISMASFLVSSQYCVTNGIVFFVNLAEFTEDNTEQE